MDKAKLIQIWHYANIASVIVAGLVVDLTPVVAQWPKVSAVVAALGLVSAGFSTFLTEIAKNKLLQAVVDAPAVPTPTGLGIPAATPDAPK